MLDFINKNKYPLCPVNPLIPENLPEVVEIVQIIQLAKVMNIFQVKVDYLGRGEWTGKS